MSDRNVPPGWDDAWAVSDYFSTQFKAAAERIAADKPVLWDGIRETLTYLIHFRHQAIAPDVRWGIALSAYGRQCGEIRWPDPEIQSDYPNDAWRGLFVAHPNDDWYVFTVLGNKARSGNAWYDKAVPESDAVVDRAIEQLGLQPFPSE